MRFDSKKACIFGLLFLLVIIMGVLALAIYQYRSGAVGYDKLEQREYTFVKYEITRGRGGGTIKIYVEEEKLPLCGCPNFVRKAIDEELLAGGRRGDKLTVWISHSRSASDTYSADVHEGKINGQYFMRLEDYQKYHAKNDILGLVICSIMVVCNVAGIGYYLIAIAKENG